MIIDFLIILICFTSLWYLYRLHKFVDNISERFDNLVDNFEKKNILDINQSNNINSVLKSFKQKFTEIDIKIKKQKLVEINKK